MVPPKIFIRIFGGGFLSQFSGRKKTLRLLRSVRGSVYFIYIVDFIGFGFQSGRQELLYVEGVPWICVGCVSVVGVLGDVVLVRQERPHTTQLEDTFSSVHDSQFILAHQFFAQLLIIQGVGGFPPTVFTGVVVE